MHQKERVVLHFDLGKLTQSRKSLKKSHVSKLLWSVSINLWFIYFLWVLMLFSSSPMFSYNCYKRALISSAATSALRLHQRLPVSTSTLSSSSLLYHYDCHFLTTTKFFLLNLLRTTTQNAKILQLSGHLLEVIKHRSTYNALFPAPSLTHLFEPPNCPG